MLLLEKAQEAGREDSSYVRRDAVLLSPHDCDARGIVEAFGANGKFLHSALACLGPRETIAFFNAEGVATKVEDTGKIFPVSDRALDVLDALLKRLARSGATLALTEPLEGY